MHLLLRLEGHAMAVFVTVADGSVATDAAGGHDEAATVLGSPLVTTTMTLERMTRMAGVVCEKASLL